MRLSLKSAPLALALSAGSLFAQSPADDVILGALRIGSLTDLATSAGEFANHIRPGSGAATAQLTAGAAQFGIDPAGEILALVIDPQKSALPYAFVVTTLDPEAIKGNPAFGFKPAAQADRYQITLGRQTMFAAFVGKRLVVSPLEAGLDAVLPAVGSGEDIRRLRAAGGQLALSLSTARLYAAYKPMIDGMLSGMRGQFAKAASGAATPTPNPADIYGSFLGSVGELQSVSLRVAITPDHLELRSLVEATPGTATSSLLNPGRGPAVSTLGLHDPASTVLGTLSARPRPEFWSAYNGLVTKFIAASGAPGTAESGQAMAKAVDDFAAIWDGTASFGMLSPGETMSGSGVAGITDQTRALALIKTLPEMQKNLAALNSAQGLVANGVFGEEETYHDARLIDFTQTYQALNPATEESLKMLKKLGLERLSVTYAVAPDRVLYTMGEGAHPEAKRMVDTPKTAPAPVSPAAYGLPERTTLFAAVSLPRYAAWIARTGAFPMQIGAVPADLKPGLALSADLDAGRADLRLHLAASEIAALISAFTPPPAPAAAAPVK